MTYLETAVNGTEIPWPDEPPDVGDQHHGDQHHGGDWTPVDLGPYLRGEILRPQPSIGLFRSDGQQIIYAAREHVVLGETESGKTWVAAACVAADLRAGHYVVYVHYEEGNAQSTVERQLLLGVDAAVIAAQLRFVAQNVQSEPASCRPS